MVLKGAEFSTHCAELYWTQKPAYLIPLKFLHVKSKQKLKYTEFSRASTEWYW
jgi:hypothetical protein